MSELQPAIDLIKHWEGLVLHAYRDSVGVWTIGWGTTKGVSHGMTCTREQATEWLMRDVQECAKAVRSYVHVPLTAHETCALISLSYNIGLGGLQHSTLVKKLNAGHPHEEVADEFMKWVHAKGRVLHGLVNRRREERLVFLSA